MAVHANIACQPQQNVGHITQNAMPDKVVEDPAFSAFRVEFQSQMGEFMHTIDCLRQEVADLRSVQSLPPDRDLNRFDIGDSPKQPVLQIASCQRPHSFINIVVENLPVCALVDTGSAVTIITRKVWNCLKAKVKRKLSKCPENLSFANADGHKLNMDGLLPVRIAIGATELNMNVFVCDSISFDCILGIDFLETQECAVCYRNKVLTIDNSTVPLLDMPFKMGSRDVFLDDNIRIPPSTEVCVPAYFIHNSERRPVPSHSVLIEGRPEIMDKYGVMIGSYLTTTEGCLIQARIANLTDDDIELPEGTRIATLSPVLTSGDVACIQSGDLRHS